jgi:UDP-3-O-[3-hydroxymyristoyl] glucosamine N-acyltransferase
MRAAESGIRLADLAAAVGGEAAGDPDLRIMGAAGLEDAFPGAIVRVEHPRHLQAALDGPASALLVPRNFAPVEKPCVRVDGVPLAFVRCLQLFSREETPPPGIHPTAVLGPGVAVGEGCSVGAYAVLGRDVRLGPDVVIHPHVVLGEEVEVGAGSRIFPHAVLYAGTILGARVRIHSGAVIGSDGFGYEWTGQEHLKKPHNGRVRIGDDVEIGANSTVDRATTGETFIGPGTKIDNLAQIAHNVRTGAHCLLVAQVGVAGSSTLGNGVVLAGQAGVSDHVHLGDGVRVGAGSGIVHDEPPGAVISGYYQRPHREHLKIHAALGELPGLLRRVRELERRLAGAAGVEPEE